MTAVAQSELDALNWAWELERRGWEADHPVTPAFIEWAQRR